MRAWLKEDFASKEEPDWKEDFSVKAECGWRERRLCLKRRVWLKKVLHRSSGGCVGNAFSCLLFGAEGSICRSMLVYWPTFLGSIQNTECIPEGQRIELASKNLHRGLKFFKKRTDSLRVSERPPTTFDHFNLRARSNPSVMDFVPMQLHGTADTLLTHTSRHVSHVNTQYINAVKIDDSGWKDHGCENQVRTLYADRGWFCSGAADFFRGNTHYELWEVAFDSENVG